ncbi:MAG: MmcQ/YjbR family DNA-binding protein [Myxococcales bacterium]|nr:MmcQ/YjbR family DNA-binding protein [Myxococcales bacterium]
MTPEQLYRWLAKLVATLPATKITITWGEPHFRVGEKIFSGWGQGKDGRYSVGIKLDKDKQAALVASDSRFEVAPYVGKHGWASFFPGDDPDLSELEALVVESYCNIAPRHLAAKASPLAQRAAQEDAGQRKGMKASKTSKPKPKAKTSKAGKAKASKASAWNHLAARFRAPGVGVGGAGPPRSAPSRGPRHGPVLVGASAGSIRLVGGLRARRAGS